MSERKREIIKTIALVSNLADRTDVHLETLDIKLTLIMLMLEQIIDEREYKKGER